MIARGVLCDLYLFEPESLDPALCRQVEAAGGVIRKIDFPASGAVVGAFLKELLRHPWRTLRSLVIGLDALLRCPSEGIRALGVLPASIALSRQLLQSRVTQTHGLWAGVPATVSFWVWRHGGIPFSFAGHAWDITGRTVLLPRKVAACRAMVVCSEFARKTVVGLCPPALREKVQLVHHGLNLDRWSYGPEATEGGDEAERSEHRLGKILAVGRLTPKKGYEVLVDACGRLRDRGLRLECDIIGPDAGMGAGLMDRIRQLRLDGMVRLAGEMDEQEVLRAMRKADVLAVPSVKTETGDSDGIPNVVLEAMAVGLPVVTTDAGGLGEVVIPEVTGLMAPQRDPEALAGLLGRVLTDGPAARRRAFEARRRLETTFESGVTTRRLIAVIGLTGAPKENEGDLNASALVR